jgi:hypothetical protein
MRRPAPSTEANSPASEPGFVHLESGMFSQIGGDTRDRFALLGVASPSDLRLLSRFLGEPHYAGGELSSGSLQ